VDSTGFTTLQTPSTSDNSTKAATTAFVKNQGYSTLASPTFTGTITAPNAVITDKVGIGTTNPRYTLDVYGLLFCDYFVANHSQHGGNNFRFGWTGTQFILQVDATPFIVTILPSDYRVKKNFRNPINVLERLNNLKMFEYQYKDVGAFKSDGSYYIGFFAHELQELFPEYENIVHGEKDGYQSDNNELQIQQINSSLFSNILLKAIQEQQESINNLENRLKTMEARLDAAGL
jgi:hypothetical protein